MNELVNIVQSIEILYNIYKVYGLNFRHFIYSLYKSKFLVILLLDKNNKNKQWIKVDPIQQVKRMS